jgi:hypothetical protein
MANKGSLHRETLRAALRVLQSADTLEQARTQLARMLNIFDKLEKQGLKSNDAIREAETRLATSPPPKPSNADEQPIRRRSPDKDAAS